MGNSSRYCAARSSMDVQSATSRISRLSFPCYATYVALSRTDVMYRTNAPEVNTIIGQVVTIVQHTLHILPYDFSLARSKLDEWKCRRRSKQTLSRAPLSGRVHSLAAAITKPRSGPPEPDASLPRGFLREWRDCNKGGYGFLAHPRLSGPSLQKTCCRE